MAKRGVTVVVRGPDGRLLPVGSEQRAQRIRDAAERQRRSATTDLDELAAAFDYARSAARAAGRGGLDPAADVKHAVRLLWAMGDALTARLGAKDG